MTKSPQHAVVAAVLAVGAVFMLVLAMYFHSQYGKAHAEVRKLSRASTGPVFLIPDTRPLDYARWSSLGACASAVIAFLAAAFTKRRSWFVCVIVSFTSALLAVGLTEVMY